MISISKPHMSEEEKKAVLSVLDSGMIASGERVREFESLFSKIINTKSSIATSNGTTALHSALIASGIKPGDEVITTPFSFISTANSILFCGAVPVFADIDPKTFNIDPKKIEEKITPRTKAIMPVHLYGQPCDMGRIMKIANEKSLKVIEDACQSHGAEYKGKKTGSFGDAACFSFYATKNITTGEGGMVTTNSQEIEKKVRLFINHGQDEKYIHGSLGHNYRMTDIAAAIGIEQLKKLDEINRRRIENASKLTELLNGIRGIVTPFVSKEVKHVFHQYTIRVTDDFKATRDELRAILSKNGIMANVYYPVPINRQPHYANLGYKEPYKEAEKASQEVLSLPVHPGVKVGEMNKIADAIRNIS